MNISLIHKKIKYFAFAIILIAGCTAQNNEIPIIDLDSVSEQTDVKLSDLLDDIRILKLDFVEGEPIPDYFIPWVGEKHILINTRHKILQYSVGGKFVRILMSNGSGPGEFKQVIAYDVDEKNDILYFYDVGGTNKISRIDLISGNALEDIPLPTDDRLTYGGLLLIDTNTLLCFANEFSDAKHLFYYLSIAGDVRYGMPKTPIADESLFASSSLYLRKYGSGLRYMPNYDTVFTLDVNEVVPEYILHANDVFNMSEDNMEGYLPKLYLESSKYSLIHNPELKALTMEGGGFRINTIEDAMYILDKNSFLVSRIKEFEIDYLGHNEASPRFYVSGDNAFLAYDVVKLMEIADNVLSNKDAEKILADRMTKLRQTLNENDNPYFLIGKIK